MSFLGHKPIALAVQAVDLKTRFPESISRITRGELVWTAEINPHPLSRTYTVELKYKLKKRPSIRVVKPVLEHPDDKQLPHVYPRDLLCVYNPMLSDWNESFLLSTYIMPWISEWLANYEIWLTTGVWCGGGTHPKRTARGQVFCCIIPTPTPLYSPT